MDLVRVRSSFRNKSFLGLRIANPRVADVLVVKYQTSGHVRIQNEHLFEKIIVCLSIRNGFVSWRRQGAENVPIVAPGFESDFHGLRT